MTSEAEFVTKVEVLPGIELTPRLLLSQVLGDADDLAGVIIVTVLKSRGQDDDGYVSACHTGVRASELALASVLLAHRVHQRVED